MGLGNQLHGIQTFKLTLGDTWGGFRGTHGDTWGGFRGHLGTLEDTWGLGDTWGHLGWDMGWVWGTNSWDTDL